MKFRNLKKGIGVDGVTPCVGVWIEINVESKAPILISVTPCVGVWIEICCLADNTHHPIRHSLRGFGD